MTLVVSLVQVTPAIGVLLRIARHMTGRVQLLLCHMGGSYYPARVGSSQHVGIDPNMSLAVEMHGWSSLHMRGTVTHVTFPTIMVVLK